MSEILIISDTHYGIKGDSAIMMENAHLFLDEIFFPLIKERNIKHVLHLGDLVDKRQGIAFITANFIRTKFIEPLNDMGIETHIITRKS